MSGQLSSVVSNAEGVAVIAVIAAGAFLAWKLWPAISAVGSAAETGGKVVGAGLQLADKGLENSGVKAAASDYSSTLALAAGTATAEDIAQICAAQNRIWAQGGPKTAKEWGEAILYGPVLSTEAAVVAGCNKWDPDKESIQAAMASDRMALNKWGAGGASIPTPEQIAAQRQYNVHKVISSIKPTDTEADVQLYCSLNGLSAEDTNMAMSAFREQKSRQVADNLLQYVEVLTPALDTLSKQAKPLADWLQSPAGQDGARNFNDQLSKIRAFAAAYKRDYMYWSDMAKRDGDVGKQGANNLAQLKESMRKEWAKGGGLDSGFPLVLIALEQ